MPLILILLQLNLLIRSFLRYHCNHHGIAAYVRTYKYKSSKLARR